MKKKVLSLTLCVVALMMSSCIFCIHDLVKTHVKNYDSPERYSIGNFCYDANDVDAIEIDWVMGDITLVQSTNNKLQVSESGRNLCYAQQMHYWLDGRTLKIQFAEADYYGEFNECEKDLRVELPIDISLSIHTIAGQVNSNAMVLNNLSIANISGHVQLAGIDAFGANFSSVSGHIQLGETRVDDLKIATTSGHVSLDINNIGARVNYSTICGSYSAPGGRTLFGDGHCQMRISTTSGNLTIQ